MKLPCDEPLFSISGTLIKSFDLDLSAADIPKADERGRTVDLHALRHTFGTHLSKNGVAPRTAQAAMRHSSLDLTMNVYTDPELLDVAGAVEALPRLNVDGATLPQSFKAVEH
jgi:integrase